MLLGIAAVCTYYIMYHKYQNLDQDKILVSDLHHPILSQWVAELSHTFVGDLIDAVPYTGMIINDAQGFKNWEHDVRMFEDYEVPIWIHWSLDLRFPFDKQLDWYYPSQEDVDVLHTQHLWGTKFSDG